MAEKPATIDAYMAQLDDDKRAALQALREAILAAAPEAQEVISYQVPAFRLDGMLVSFGAATSHCAFYVQSPAVMEALKDDLAGYDTSKGTIRFAPDTRLPEALVRKVVEARVAENRAAAARRKTL